MTLALGAVMAADGALYLSDGSVTAEVPPPSGGVLAAVRELVQRELAMADIVDVLRGKETGTDAVGAAERLVGLLSERCWLARTTLDDGNRLYTIDSFRRRGTASRVATETAVLSKFAILRRGGGDFVLESARSDSRLRIHDHRIVTLLSMLVAPRPTELGAAGLPAAVTAQFVNDLRDNGFVVEPGGDEDQELRFRQWGVHELWFLSQSRMGGRRRLGRNYGSTFWAREEFESAAGAKPKHVGRSVALPMPDMARLRSGDRTLTSVLEDRRSITVHDDSRPLRLAELGEFLYRSLGTRPDRGNAARPYPAAGGCYELEYYLVIRMATGIEPGCYHYNTSQHSLVHISALTDAAESVIRASAQSAGRNKLPQILIIITACFAKLMTKYQAMGLSLIFKDVGVVLQVMYSVATAMRLAPRALGVGLADEFCEVGGLDFFEESPVGEFILGSRVAE